MDPDTAADEAADALDEGDYELATVCLNNIADWLDAGGFLPSPGALARLLRSATYPIRP